MNLKALLLLAKRTAISPYACMGPLLLALCAAVFEGITCSLLFPTLQVINGETESLNNFRRWMLPFGSYELTPRWIALCAIASVMGSMLLKTGCGYLSALSSAKLTRGFVTALRIELISSLLRSNKAFFDKENSGKLQEVLTTHVSSLAHSLSALHGALFAASCLFIYIGLMVTISLPLTLVAVVLLPIVGLAIRAVTFRLSATSLDYAGEFNSYGTHLANILSNIGLVKAHAAESGEISRFTHRAQHLGALEYSLDKKSHILGPIQELGSVAILSVLLVLFGWAAQNSSTTLSQQLVFLLVLRRSSNMLSSLSAARGAIAGTSGSLREIVSLVNTELSPGNQQHDKGDISLFTGLHTSINIHELTFIHSRENTVLKDLCAEVKAGEFVGITGPSGSGKSTILALLLKLYDVPPGTIQIDGIDLQRIDRESYLRSVAYVAQDTYLLYGTLRENLCFGLTPLPNDEQLLSAIALAQLKELFERLPYGLETLIGDKGVLLSGGERQRLAIARAVLRDASIWLLDEPTSSLDSTTELEVLDVLEPLLRGKTVVMVSHRSVPLRKADQVYDMVNGTLSLSGSGADLCTTNLSPSSISSPLHR